MSCSLLFLINNARQNEDYEEKHGSGGLTDAENNSMRESLNDGHKNTYRRKEV